MELVSTLLIIRCAIQGLPDIFSGLSEDTERHDISHWFSEAKRWHNGNKALDLAGCWAGSNIGNKEWKTGTVGTSYLTKKLAKMQRLNKAAARPQVSFSIKSTDLAAPNIWLALWPPKVLSTPPPFGFWIRMTAIRRMQISAMSIVINLSMAIGCNYCKALILAAKKLLFSGYFSINRVYMSIACRIWPCEASRSANVSDIPCLVIPGSAARAKSSS